jgi:hypothetical protein
MFETLRRHTVATIVKLTNVDSGGTWELVNVKEEALVTTITFHIKLNGYHEIHNNKDHATHHVQVTISALADSDPEATQLLPTAEYQQARRPDYGNDADHMAQRQV